MLVALIGIISSTNIGPFYGFSSLVQDFSSSLEVPIGELQLCITFCFIGITLGLPLAGWLIDRFSIRSVALNSLALATLLYVLAGIVPLSLNLLYLFYFLFPLIGCGSLFVTWTQLVCNSFEEKRGIALAIILSGSGVASTSVPLLLSNIAGTENWQYGFFVLAGMTLVTYIVCLFMLPKPETNQTTAASGKHESSEKPKIELGVSYREALRTRQMWTMIVALILFIFVVISMVANIVPMLTSKGFTRTEASQMFGAFGIALIVGRISGGFFLDKFWGPLVAFFALIMPAVGCLIFLTAPPTTALMITATALVGVATGAEYDIMAYLVSRYFGLKAYSKIFGTVATTIAFGSALSPLVFGPLLDASGSYDLLLKVCSVSAATCATLFLTLGPYPTYVNSGSSDMEKPGELNQA